MQRDSPKPAKAGTGNKGGNCQFVQFGDFRLFVWTA